MARAFLREMQIVSDEVSERWSGNAEATVCGSYDRLHGRSWKKRTDVSFMQNDSRRVHYLQKGTTSGVSTVRWRY